jgi:hypothetical protein
MIRRYIAILVTAGLAACDPSVSPDPGSGPPDAPGGNSPPPSGTSSLTFESGPVRPLALSADGSHVYVANTPNGSLDILRVTPDAISKGRPFLYDAPASSSNGEAACASCHMFGDTDTLAWDLGNPDADIVETPINVKGKRAAPTTINGNGDVARLHPLKGPMVTQTMRGMVNHGTMHWRGDRVSGYFGTDTSAGPPYDSQLAFKNFIVAFDGLLGRDTQIADADMQTFSDFALSIVMPPNPIRNLDNSRTDAQARGLAFFMGCDGLDSVTGAPVACQDGRPPAGGGHFADGVAGIGRGNPCEGCHRLDPASGFFGTDGEMAFGGQLQTMKIPQLRNLYTKVGMFGVLGDGTSRGPQVRSTGFQNGGAVDTVFRFVSAPLFQPNAAGTTGFIGGDDQRRDVEQFILAFDTDLAPIVGQQITLDATNAAVTGPRIDLLIARARTPFVSKLLGGAVTECDLVARGVIDGHATTFTLAADGRFTADGDAGAISDAALRAIASVPGQQITYTCLPPGWPH